MSTPDPMNIDPRQRRRNRVMLVGLFVLFLIPPVLAAVLLALDWRPAHTKNYGELLSAPIALADLELLQADGDRFEWNPHDRRWQAAVVATPDCGPACVELLAGLDKVWRLQGRKADRFWVLWFGDLPQGGTTFRTLVPMKADPDVLDRLPDLPRNGAPAVYLIDPSGFVALRYPPDFDLAGLRADVAQMLK